MDAELAKIIRGLENSAHERGVMQGTAMGIIETFKALDAGKTRKEVIEELLHSIPHAYIRSVIESDKSGYYLIEEIEEQLCD